MKSLNGHLDLLEAAGASSAPPTMRALLMALFPSHSKYPRFVHNVGPASTCRDPESSGAIISEYRYGNMMKFVTPTPQ
jgi:hypothetical protein